MKTCPNCKVQFEDKRHPNKKYCCVECWKNDIYILCDCCGKSFPDPHKERSGAKFCSWICRIKSKNKIKKCPTCGKEFRVSAASTKKYCSKDCVIYSGRKKNTDKRSIFICNWCGKEFEEWTYRKPTICSNQCRSEYGASVRAKQLYKGGSVVSRGMNWKSQARLARKRDNHTCQACGRNGWLDKFRVQVHHIIPYRLFNEDYDKANSLDNLISLCPSCHPKVESGTVVLRKS